MKVWILGPVTTESYFGGVAAFDEGLRDAFESLGHESTIYTRQELPSEKLAGGKVRKLDMNILASSAREGCPDICIASLQYGAVYLVPQMLKNAVKVYWLHGFFSRREHPRHKVMFGPLLQKAIARRSDLVISNSEFTAQVNENEAEIASDAIVAPGIDDSYVSCPAVTQRKLPSSVLYAGRMIRAKRPAVVVQAIKSLHDKGLAPELYMAGDGPERTRLENLVSSLPYIHMLGRRDGQSLRELYLSSEIFISLNDAEPYGMAYAEALCSGCKIVCPRAGGQVSFLEDYGDRVRFVSGDDAEEIADAIEDLLSIEVLPLSNDELVQFGAKACARNILKAIEAKLPEKLEG